MNEQWQELKETIIELRDGDGTGTQQEVCKFLVNYMGILEKQMQESVVSKQVVIDIVDSYSESRSNVEDVTQDIISDIVALPPVNPQPKVGHWIEYTRVLIPEPINKWEQAWYCSACGYGNQECEDGSAWLEWKYCPNCGAKMVEPQESEKDEHMTADEFAELFTGSED